MASPQNDLTTLDILTIVLHTKQLSQEFLLFGLQMSRVDHFAWQWIPGRPMMHLLDPQLVLSHWSISIRTGALTTAFIMCPNAVSCPSVQIHSASLWVKWCGMRNFDKSLTGCTKLCTAGTSASHSILVIASTFFGSGFKPSFDNTQPMNETSLHLNWTLSFVQRDVLGTTTIQEPFQILVVVENGFFGFSLTDD